MAAVISEFVSDSSPFYHHHTTMVGPGQQPSSAEYQQRSRSRAERIPAPAPALSPAPQPPTVAAGTPPPSTTTRPVAEDAEIEPSATRTSPPLSPPSSSSPSHGQYIRSYTNSSQRNFQDSNTQYGRQNRDEPEQESEDLTVRTAAPLSSTLTSHPLRTNGPRSAIDVTFHPGENTIKVRDLAHIQELANEEFLTVRGHSGRQRIADEPTVKYEISGMPITDIIEMVAGLLTKITTTNDRQHETLHRPVPSTGDASNLSGLSSSVLAFHGKNVPSITILSYLSRIHKYCPTTYEVFLSLLVYFDRMTERVNAAPTHSLRTDPELDSDSRPSTSYSASGSDLAESPPTRARPAPENMAGLHPSRENDIAAFPLSHFFVVDSFNIHRLVIAGVTCASKFFSDVFYTNSRYAKVGGLPLAELNHLELQFLLLNDFRLSVPVEELEAYGTMLVEFYAREVMAQRDGRSGNTSYSDEDGE